MSVSNPSFTAAGNISPSRWVTISGEHKVQQVTAVTQIIHGLMQEGERRAPGSGLNPSGYAAIDGDSGFRVYGPLEQALVLCGANVSAGDWVKSTTDAMATPWVSNHNAVQHIGGRALHHAASGELCRVQVYLQTIAPLA